MKIYGIFLRTKRSTIYPLEKCRHQLFQTLEEMSWLILIDTIKKATVCKLDLCVKVNKTLVSRDVSYSDKMIN